MVPRSTLHARLRSSRVLEPSSREMDATRASMSRSRRSRAARAPEGMGRAPLAPLSHRARTRGLPCRRTLAKSTSTAPSRPRAHSRGQGAPTLVRPRLVIERDLQRLLPAVVEDDVEVAHLLAAASVPRFGAKRTERPDDETAASCSISLMSRTLPICAEPSRASITCRLHGGLVPNQCPNVPKRPG